MTNRKVFSSFFWRLAERCGAQGVTFIVSIVLARLLEPNVYGTIALVTAITAIFQVFIDGGMASALIQKKNADDMDFSTCFYANITVCIILYIGVFIAAPAIANFYGSSELTPIIRVLSLTLIISGVKNVQQAYVSRNMLFKRFFFATLGGTVGAAIVGIGMAYAGYGVWALVAQQLFNQTVDTIILWVTVKWRPQREFSFERLKGLFGFGWKMLVSGLLESLYNNMRQLIIGKVYSGEELAYYNQGDKIPGIVVTNINAAINSVLLPAMAKEQDSGQRVKNMTRRAIKTSVYVMAPILMGICFAAEPLVRLLLTDKWLPCVPFFRIFCIHYMFFPIHTANLSAITAMGRSDLFLKQEILKIVVGIAMIASTVQFGVIAMAYGLLVTSVMCQVINAWPNRKLINYSYLEQMKDILPIIILAVIMGATVNIVGIFHLPDILTLGIQVILGGAIYVMESIVFKVEPFQYLLVFVRSYISEK